jgi:hypothetical protein
MCARCQLYMRLPCDLCTVDCRLGMTLDPGKAAGDREASFTNLASILNPLAASTYFLPSPSFENLLAGQVLSVWAASVTLKYLQPKIKYLVRLNIQTVSVLRLPLLLLPCSPFLSLPFNYGPALSPFSVPGHKHSVQVTQAGLQAQPVLQLWVYFWSQSSLTLRLWVTQRH